MYTVVLLIRQIYCLLQLDFTGSLVAGFIGLPLEYNLFFFLWWFHFRYLQRNEMPRESSL